MHDCRTGARTVLLADDNVDGLDMLSTFLALLGFQVRVARDGCEAVRLASESLPDVAILDLGMPGLDGWDACRAIRRLRGGAQVRMIALSGWGSEDARQRSEAAGFDAHWVKPAHPPSILTLLAEPLPDPARAPQGTRGRPPGGPSDGGEG